MAQLSSFGHVPLQALEQFSIVSQEGAISAATATSRAGNVVGVVVRHVCCVLPHARVNTPEAVPPAEAVVDNKGDAKRCYWRRMPETSARQPQGR